MTGMNLEKIHQIREARKAGIIGNHFEHMRICCTGKMSMTRDDMHALIRAVGGVPELRVTYGVNYLIIGDTGAHGRTKKIQDAERAYLVKVITEQEFVEMIMKSAKVPPS